MPTHLNKYSSTNNGVKPIDKTTQHTQSYRYVI